MPNVAKIETKARRNPRLAQLLRSSRPCVPLLWRAAQGSGSHVAIFKMPWQGDPRINLQAGAGGSAKEYQVKQLVKAIEKLKEENQ